MPKHSLDNVLDATAAAIATFTHAADEVRHQQLPITTIVDHADALVRTLSRLQVLATMHPALTVTDDVPAGAVADAEWEAWAAECRVLDDLVRMPATPATVTVRVPTHVNEADAHAALEALYGAVLPVTVTYDGPVLDLTALIVATVGDPFDDGDDATPAFIESDSPAARELRRHFR